MMQTTVTIGSASNSNINDLAKQVSDHDFSIRPIIGYWRGEVEDSVDFVLVDSGDIRIEAFIRALVEWATGVHSLSPMSEEAVLVTQHEVKVTMRHKPDWLDSLRDHYQYRSEQ